MSWTMELSWETRWPSYQTRHVEKERWFVKNAWWQITTNSRSNRLKIEVLSWTSQFKLQGKKKVRKNYCIRVIVITHKVHVFLTFGSFVFYALKPTNDSKTPKVSSMFSVNRLPCHPFGHQCFGCLFRCSEIQVHLLCKQPNIDF